MANGIPPADISIEAKRKLGIPITPKDLNGNLQQKDIDSAFRRLGKTKSGCMLIHDLARESGFFESHRLDNALVNQYECGKRDLFLYILKKVGEIQHGTE